ncbi:hypothetical protein B0H10DRAFT_2236012 [Mycena sp. CBHHK59/15]|nr:hypothetical protein B0H10DRAFT_2236012 [Mycena sp. CBHHK59/15]
MPQPTVVDAATDRDRGVCCLTGRADLPARIIWAFPPTLAYESYIERDWTEDGLHETYRTVDNAFTLRVALIEPFTQNMFSVDVKPSRRVPGPPECSPTPFPPPSTFRFRLLLASAFQRTLGIHILGGDPSTELENTAYDLMDEFAEDVADLNEPKWHSGVGAEVLEEWLKQRFVTMPQRAKKLPGGLALNATPSKYVLLVDANAGNRRLAPRYHPATFYGQLQNIFVVKLPISDELGLKDETTLILAAVHRCETYARKDVDLDIHYYQKEGRLEVVDMTSIQCLVGRVKTTNGKDWAIIDRSGSLARPYSDPDDN